MWEADKAYGASTIIGVFGGCPSVSDKKQSVQSKRPQCGNLVSGGFLKLQAACAVCQL